MGMTVAGLEALKPDAGLDNARPLSVALRPRAEQEDRLNVRPPAGDTAHKARVGSLAKHESLTHARRHWSSEATEHERRAYPGT